MTTLELQGQITENGDLEIQFPAGLPAGKVTVRIEMPEHQTDADNQSWTDEEIQEMMRPRRKTMKELTAWLDANPPTEEWGGMKPEDDPSEFIHNLRRSPKS